MHDRTAAIVAALLTTAALGARAAAPDPAPPVSVAHATGVQAHGNEPGWRLVLGPEDVRLWASGIDMQAVLPNAEPVPGGFRYSTPGRTTITVFNRVCADSLTGMPYPYQVEVRHIRRTLRGCGGDPKTLLQDTEWVVQSIDGQAVADGVRSTLAFGANGSLGGSGGCNRYTSSWRLSADSLTLGPAAATRRACAGAEMPQEDKFFAALPLMQRFELTAAGELVLHGAEGRRIVAKRS